MDILRLDRSFEKLRAIAKTMSANIDKAPKELINANLQSIQLICINSRANDISEVPDENEIIVYDLLDSINMYIINLLVTEQKVTLDNLVHIFNLSSKYYMLKDSLGV